MASFVKFVGGLVVGAAAGAAVIAFTTPKTGDQTRSTIKASWTDALTTGRAAAKEREAELWAEFNTRVKETDGVTLPL